jgi:hypothetical protein
MTRLIITFIGSVKGITTEQLRIVRKLLWRYEDREVELHHGDGVKSDEAVHPIAVQLGFRVVAHPALDHFRRACCDVFSCNGVVMDPQPAMKRNHEMVDVASVVIAAPECAQGKKNNVTWDAIAYAIRTGKEVIIANLDGSATYHTPIADELYEQGTERFTQRTEPSQAGREGQAGSDSVPQS